MSKTLRHQYNGLLKLLPIIFCFWTDIILDFIIGLLINKNYNTILIIIDYLTQ